MQAENFLTLSNMSPQVGNAHSLITRLQDHNIMFMSQGQNSEGADALYVYAVPERQDEVVIGEISISMGGIVVQAKSRAPHMVPLFLQTLSFLLSASI